MDAKKKVLLVLVVVIVISFFLPWVSIESKAVGSVTKLLTGKKQATINSISGFKVPILANSEESRFMITIIKIFQPDIENADKKKFSYLDCSAFCHRGLFYYECKKRIINGLN